MSSGIFVRLIISEGSNTLMNQLIIITDNSETAGTIIYERQTLYLLVKFEIDYIVPSFPLLTLAALAISYFNQLTTFPGLPTKTPRVNHYTITQEADKKKITLRRESKTLK